MSDRPDGAIAVEPSEIGAIDGVAAIGLSDRVARIICRFAPTTIAIGILAAFAVPRYLDWTNADALLPALMSTQQWTLFYWGQDRLGNLVPLLTTPIRDPVWNFEVQTLIIASAFFGLGGVFVSYYAWARRDRIRPLEHAIATGVTGLVVMVPMQTVAGYRFAVEQLYFVSMVLWVAAVWAWLGRRWYAASCVALLAAMLVNPSLLLATPLVWIIDTEREGRMRRFAGFVGVSAAAFVVTNLAARFFATGPDVDEPYDKFRLDHLDTGTQLVAGKIAGSMRDHLAAVVVVAVVAVVAVAGRHLVPRCAAVYAILPAFAVAWFLAFSTNAWVAQNLHEFRYFYPLYAVFMAYTAAAVTEVVLFTRRWRASERRLNHSRLVAAVEVALVVTTGAIAILAIHRHEVPALANASEPVAAAARHDALLVAGNYWAVWPIVVAGRADGLDMLGVSYRSDPIDDKINEMLSRPGVSDRGTAVLCAGVDADGCLDAVNEWSSRRWRVDEVLSEAPLVIRLVPSV